MTEWPEVARRGYSLRLPPGLEPAEVDPGTEELATFSDPATGMVVGTYRWHQPFTGALGLEVTLGHVELARAATSAIVRRDEEGRREVDLVCDLEGSTVSLAAVRLADGDVAVVSVEYPSAHAPVVRPVAEKIVASLCPAPRGG